MRRISFSILPRPSLAGSRRADGSGPCSSGGYAACDARRSGTLPMPWVRQAFGVLRARRPESGHKAQNERKSIIIIRRGHLGSRKNVMSRPSAVRPSGTGLYTPLQNRDWKSRDVINFWFMPRIMKGCSRSGMVAGSWKAELGWALGQSLRQTNPLFYQNANNGHQI